jgi:IclR family acetate operon transcriptional repressor
MDGLTSLDKAIDVLEHLHDAGVPRGVTEIANALGVPKSSAHRLLKTLVRRGFAEQETAGRYRVGPALIALGIGSLDREPLAALARPVLECEAAAIGETVFLVAPRGRELSEVNRQIPSISTSTRSPASRSCRTWGPASTASCASRAAPTTCSDSRAASR